MNIVILSQPYPMGNGCGLNAAVGEYLQKQGHTVYMLEQLNGQMAGVEAYAELISSVNPDLLYYEMLDDASFKAIEKVDAKKILTFASNGILKNYEDILDHPEWYNGIYTNSLKMVELFNERGIKNEHFQYYHCWMNDDNRKYDARYEHDCCFLGMGFNRLSSESYKMERELFFLNQFPFDFAIYGNGWPREIPWYNGLLPQEDMGKLYKSVKSAMAIIAPGQRKMGMINNRFVEIGFCGAPIITYPYPEVDWFGAEKYLNFVTTPQEIIQTVERLKTPSEEDIEKTNNMSKFVDNQTKMFYDGLLELISKI
jgi:hypothetical protein